MAVNKVNKRDGTTLIDISDSTVSAATLAQGYKAYDADGNAVNGALVPATDNLPLFLSGNTITGFSNSDITAIKSYAAYRDSGLQTVSIPNVTTINTSAFEYSRIQSLNAPAATTLDDYALHGCSRLTTLNLNSLTYLGEAAISSCGNLVSINLPAIQSMNIKAFAGSYSLEEIRLGEDFETFYTAYSANEAQFYDTPYLERLIIEASTPPRLRSTYLFGAAGAIPEYTTATFGIYVSDKTVYAAASNWSAFSSYLHDISELS